MGTVTLKTVAQVAGVSVTTVSNAYNRPDQLSPAVREGILETARRLGYAGPNATARSLRQGRAGVTGVLFNDTLPYALSDPYAVGFLRGIADVAEPHGTGLVPVGGLGVDAVCDATHRAIVDGLCLECIDETDPVIDVIRDRKLPVVSTVRSTREDLPYVGIDETLAGCQAAEHLARLGHQRVGVVMEGQRTSRGLQAADNEFSSTADHGRVRGFREGMGNASVAVVSTRGNKRIHGTQAAADLLDRQNRPTAIFALSDVLATGVLDALQQRGLTPGKDVSVIGFDDLPVAAENGLTSISQPVLEKGQRAASYLLDPQAQEPRTTLDTHVVVRSSTGPAPR